MSNFCTAVGLSAFIRAVYLSDADCFGNDTFEMATACSGVQNKMAEVSHAERDGQKEPRFVFLDAHTVDMHGKTFAKAAGQRVYIFDIDETLYPHDDEILRLRREKIIELGMLHGLSREEAEAKMRESLEKYKSTIKGFVRDFSRNEKVNRVLHNPIPNSADTLKPDRELREMLLGLEGRRVCLTNGPKEHSQNVLVRLGVADCFDTVFCCDYRNPEYISKPDAEACGIVSEVLGLGEASSVYYFEDRSENIAVATQFGWSCFHVTRSRPLKLILRELLDGSDGQGTEADDSHEQQVCV